MIDLYFTPNGDMVRDSTGDVAVTDTAWLCDAQQANIRLMTDVGDYLLYPTLGCNLSTMYGMAQTPTTGQAGVSLITSGLTREGYFDASQVSIKAVPTGQQTIRFDVTLTSGSLQQLKLSVSQNLGLT